MKIRPTGAELLYADGRTNMMNLTVAFRNFSNAPKTGRQAVSQRQFRNGRRLYWKARSTMDGLQCVRKRIPSKS